MLENLDLNLNAHESKNIQKVDLRPPNNFSIPHFSGYDIQESSFHQQDLQDYTSNNSVSINRQNSKNSLYHNKANQENIGGRSSSSLFHAERPQEYNSNALTCITENNRQAAGKSMMNLRNDSDHQL